MWCDETMSESGQNIGDTDAKAQQTKTTTALIKTWIFYGKSWKTM